MFGKCFVLVDFYHFKSASHKREIIAILSGSKIGHDSSQLLLGGQQAQTSLCKVMIFDAKFSKESHLTLNCTILCLHFEFFTIRYNLKQFPLVYILTCQLCTQILRHFKDLLRFKSWEGA